MKPLSSGRNLDILYIDDKLLRNAAALLTPSVTMIRGVVPQDWKIALVTPVRKGKRDKRDRSNYRPISGIRSISIIMEREVHSQILFHFI